MVLSTVMTLRKDRDFSYSDAQADIREELLDYSASCYVAKHFADAACECGSREFRLLLDENEGVAVRICRQCQLQHPIGDSEKYLEQAQIEECECPCGSSFFEITVGVALYPDSEDLKWLYVGCRCPNCNLTACYGDWKNEFNNYREFLARV